MIDKQIDHLFDTFYTGSISDESGAAERFRRGLAHLLWASKQAEPIINEFFGDDET